MTLDEAIESLSEPIKERSLLWGPDFMDALQLGIEALKRIKELRSVPLIYTQRLLPGETDD